MTTEILKIEDNCVYLSKQKEGAIDTHIIFIPDVSAADEMLADVNAHLNLEGYDMLSDEQIEFIITNIE